MAEVKRSKSGGNGKRAGKGRRSDQVPRVVVNSLNRHTHSVALRKIIQQGVQMKREYFDKAFPQKGAKAVESKDGWVRVAPADDPRPTWDQKVPESLALSVASVRSLMNPTHTYEFRLPISDSTIVISSNVSSALIGFTPTASPEWSGILDALFDEYRVDKLEVAYFPQIFNASTALFDRGCFHVGTDFDRTSGAPATAAEVDQFADSVVYPACLQSASGYFISNSWKHVHTSIVPKQVAVEGAISTVEWLPVGQIWPGGQLFFAATTGTNSVVTCSFTKYITVKMRMRR
jgi:hypothetical protein